MKRVFPRDSAPPFPPDVAAMHAAWAADVEAQTPGLHCPLPRSNETADETRHRFENMADQSYRLRLTARSRAIKAEWPGIDRSTPCEAPTYPSDPDPVGDFMRAEVAARTRLSARASRRAA